MIYSRIMFEPILGEEDERTLAAIDQAVKSADEGRLVTPDEARQRLGLPPARSGDSVT